MLIAVAIVLVVVVLASKSGSDSSNSTNNTPSTTSPTSMGGGAVIIPFRGRAGSSYVIDYAAQAALGWNGAVSADTTPITCNGSLASGYCAVDLTTAGAICDAANTAAPGSCAGIIYNVSDPNLPVAIPVAVRPNQWKGVASADTSPITCDGSQSSSQCMTDLVSAGTACDNADGCIGIISRLSNKISTKK